MNTRLEDFQVLEQRYSDGSWVYLLQYRPTGYEHREDMLLTYVGSEQTQGQDNQEAHSVMILSDIVHWYKSVNTGRNYWLLGDRTQLWSHSEAVTLSEVMMDLTLNNKT